MKDHNVDKVLEEIAECCNLINRLESDEELDLVEAVRLTYYFEERNQDGLTPPRLKILRDSVVILLEAIINKRYEETLTLH